MAAADESLTGVVSGDTVTLSGPGALADKSVGTGKAVTGLSLAGTDVGNYSLGGTTLTVTAKTLTASGSRTYDGTTTVAVVDETLSGVVRTDVVSLMGTGSIAGKDVGAGKAVTGLTLSGAAAANYTLGTVSLDVTAKALSLSGLTAANKTYNGDVAATINSYGTLSGVINGDTVALSSGSATATFDDKTAGTGKSVAVSGLGLTGTDARNYNIGNP